MLELHLLPARQGDAIWVRWGEGALTHQMIVDMGTTQVGAAMRKRIEQGPRDFELLVITHVDADHIGGVLSCLVDKPLDGVSFGDIWFNGRRHLPNYVEPIIEGARQGAELSEWLEKRAWNQAFGREAVCRQGAPSVHKLNGGLTVHVLGPTPHRLAELAPVWDQELQEALKKKAERAARDDDSILERVKPRARPELTSREQLTKLAAKVTGNDNSRANGSSIVLLLEHGTHRVLLTGDAYASDLLDSIGSLGLKDPLRLDAFKLPHHGSGENVSRELLQAVECPAFLVSTDGTQFRHPHAEAVACVIDAARVRPAGIHFNSRSEFTDWWSDAQWQRAFDYQAYYGDASDGLVLRFG